MRAKQHSTHWVTSEMSMAGLRIHCLNMRLLSTHTCGRRGTDHYGLSARASISNEMRAGTKQGTCACTETQDGSNESAAAVLMSSSSGGGSGGGSGGCAHEQQRQELRTWNHHGTLGSSCVCDCCRAGGGVPLPCCRSTAEDPQGSASTPPSLLRPAGA